MRGRVRVADRRAHASRRRAQLSRRHGVRLESARDVCARSVVKARSAAPQNVARGAASGAGGSAPLVSDQQAMSGTARRARRRSNAVDSNAIERVRTTPVAHDARRARGALLSRTPPRRGGERD